MSSSIVLFAPCRAYKNNGELSPPFGTTFLLLRQAPARVGRALPYTAYFLLWNGPCPTMGYLYVIRIGFAGNRSSLAAAKVLEGLKNLAKKRRYASRHGYTAINCFPTQPNIQCCNRLQGIPSGTSAI